MLTNNFSQKEMMCRCKRTDCDAAEMKHEFMIKLQKLRDIWGKPLHSTSARRCKFWNKIVGGSPKSQHLLGNASDFWFETNEELKEFMKYAIDVGFKGIGYGYNKIHIDDREKDARWEYL